MEDSINNLDLVTTNKDVNDLAARHCEDAQVSLLFMYSSSNCRHCLTRCTLLLGNSQENRMSSQGATLPSQWQILMQQL